MTVSPMLLALVRRSYLILGVALVALALTPTSSGAKPPPPPAPQLDTATASGSVDGLTNLQVEAHSGPSGENPGGGVAFDTFIEAHGQMVPVHVLGPVTCLNVTGNTAVIKFDADGTFAFGTSVVTLVDNGGGGLDRFGASVSFAPTDCSSSFALLGQPLNGRAIVFDAPPLPTSTHQCENGGFAQFGFKNRGQCVVFVVLTRVCGILDAHGIKTKFCPPTPPARP